MKATDLAAFTSLYSIYVPNIPANPRRRVDMRSIVKELPNRILNNEPYSTWDMSVMLFHPVNLISPSFTRVHTVFP
jgi:hypothetical protein